MLQIPNNAPDVFAISLEFLHGVSLALLKDVTDKTSDPLPHAALTDTIIGAFFDVATELGHGFSEEVLSRAMGVLLADRGLRVRREVNLPVHFHGRLLGTFRADLVVEETVLIEVKASAEIQPYAQTQITNYLKAAGGGLGLLLNFGRKAEFKRRVVGDPNNSLPLLRQQTE